MRTLPEAAVAQALTGWTDAQLAKRAAAFDALTPEAVAKTVTTYDDDLEPSATLTTENSFTFKGGFTDRVRSDNFLRAFIAKTSGKVSYQLYEQLRYSGDWRHFTSVNVETPDGPASLDVTSISHDVSCKYGPCVVAETFGFNVTEAQMRYLTARAAEHPVKPWRFRFKAQTGLDWTDDIAPSEAAGLLIAVDRYRAAHHFQ